MACLARRIDFRRATVLDLKQVPGLDEKTAQKILKYRDEHGSVKDFAEVKKNVQGINDRTVAGMKDCFILDQKS